MKGCYTSSAKITSINSQRTLLYITAPSTCSVIVNPRDNDGRTSITQENSTTSEQISALWQRISTLGTPTATTVTPAPDEKGDQAATVTVKTNVTASEPTYASNTEKARRAFSALIGYECNEQFVIAPGDTWGLRLVKTPAAGLDIHVTAQHQEVG